MNKKIAVVIRDRQVEALRMAVGLTLMDDEVDVFVLNRKLERSDKTALNIETIHDLDMKIYSNVNENDDVDYLPTEQLTEKLITYNHILPY